MASIFASLPVFVVDSSNVHGSFKRWSVEFNLALRMKSIELGYDIEEVTTGTGGSRVTEKVRVPRFGEDAKLASLLWCMGSDARELVSSLGVDLFSTSLEFLDVWNLLREHFEHDESEYVKLDKFVTCQQLDNEDERAYLLRVEGLSRQCDFSGGNVRERFALLIAVRGLRNSKLKFEMMADDELNWVKINKVLRARLAVQESLNALNRSDPTYPLSESKQVPAKIPVKVELHAESSVVCNPINVVPNITVIQERVGEVKCSPHRGRSDESSVSNTYHDAYNHSNRGSDNKRFCSDNHRYNGDGGSDHDDYPSPVRERRYVSHSSSQHSGCYICHNNGHIARYCPEGRCFRCQMMSHHQQDCTDVYRCRFCLREGVSARDCSCRVNGSSDQRYKERTKRKSCDDRSSPRQSSGSSDSNWRR